VLLFCTSGGIASFGLGPSASHARAPHGLAPTSPGGSQFSAARNSLGLTPTSPSVGHPTLGVIAPGGYTWSNLSRIVAGGPSPRYAGAMVWDASDGYVLLFGGASAGAVVVLSDTWSYVNGSWSNLSAQVTGAPPGLAAAQIAFDPSTHAVVMFGGEVRGGTILNLTWTYHALHWTNLTGRTGGTPHSRILAPMVTDSTDGEIVLYGGSFNGSLQSESDTWTFKNGNWTNVTLTAGTNLGTLTLPIGSDDPADHGVIMAALYQPTPTTVVYGDYLYSGGSWSNLTAVTTGTPDFL
jgi:hypothetical protein